MVHGNVGQSDLTREDMAKYIRYLVDVIGAEQKALYSYLEDRTNPYICLHGECQTLANWISVLLEAYGESFTRWDMRLHFTVFGKRYSKLTESERPKQFDDWGVRNVREEGAYLHTLIEWDGLYWDATGGGTRRVKEEYYEGMAYLLDGKRDRKRLLFNFIDWEEFKAYLDWPLTTDSLDYEWEWVDLGTGINYNDADYMMTAWMSNFDSSNPPRDNLGVFREFINHLRTDDFTSETVPDWKIHSEVQRLHSREEDFYEGDIEERIEEFREYELQDISFDLIHAPWDYDSDLVFDYAMQINEYDAMCHFEEGDIDYADPICNVTNPYPPLVVTSLYAPDPSEPWNKQYLIIDGQHRYEAIRLLRESAQEQGKPNKYNTVKAWVGKGRRAWITQPRDERGRFIRRAERIYFDDEYGGFIKGNPRANELPGEVAFPGEEERLAKIMSPEEYAELEQEVNLILSKNLPYNVESLSEDERIAIHEDIIMKILNHEYIHQCIDDEVLEWAIENNKTKGDYYAAHEIMAYVDMALRESLGMSDFKFRLTELVSNHPILTDNPDLADRVMDALTRTRKGQRFQVPAEITTLMQAFESEDYEILVVGGAVRDMLMGLKPKDYDLATNATPEEIESVVSELEGYKTVTTPEAQMARGVLTTLVLPPSGEVIEVTTFRAELGYEKGTRRPVAVAADTFYEDSLRRDFTMNALGWRLNGTILDYHEGVDDIEFGQLVAVGDASERLEEDPLRILRAVRLASRYGLEIDEELGGAIETNLPQLLTLSPERIRRELDTILKSEDGAYDLVEVGIIETIIPQYRGGYWGERGYGDGDPKFSFIADIQSYSMVDQRWPPQFNYTPRPWQPSIAYALLFKNVVTKEEFNEHYRRGPISFSKAEADMIAELLELYPVALESEEPADIVAIVTSPYYEELMLMLEYTSRSDLVDYFKPYRSRYKGKPPKGYAMTVADEYGIEPGPALGERLSEITEAIILGDIEDWDEGLNYYAAEEGDEINIMKTDDILLQEKLKAALDTWGADYWEMKLENWLGTPSSYIEDDEAREWMWENAVYYTPNHDIAPRARWDPEMYQREMDLTYGENAEKVIEEQQGEIIAPVIAIREYNGWDYLVSGHHRSASQWNAGKTTIPTIILDMSAYYDEFGVDFLEDKRWMHWEDEDDYDAETDESSEEIPEFVYHATPGENLDSIMEHGLEPRIGELSIHAFGKKRYEEKIGTPKIWATSQNKANIYASMIAPMSYLEDNAILRIKTEGLDFEFYGFEEFFTDNVVPPSHIKFMYSMDGDKSEEDPNWTVDQQIDYLHNKRGACPSIVDGERRCFDGRLCTYTEHASEEVGTRERIAYAGVILDEDTSEQLLAHFETLIPESWTRYAHHMTVSLGKSIPNQADLGTEVTLTVTAVGKSDDAIAVAVSGYPSRNAIPHITLAVPPGGKPFNSNKITDWHSVEPFEIRGQLQDVKTYVAETFRSESNQDWSQQYTWQPVPVEDLIEFRRTGLPEGYWSVLDDILNLKTLYRGTRKPSSIREGMFDFFGGGEIDESEQIPETVYFYTWERPYSTEQWRQHNAVYECACDECKNYVFHYSNVNCINSGLINSTERKPEWNETPAGSEIVRVLFIPHMGGINTPTIYKSITRRNLDLPRYGFEPLIWSGEFYSSPYNTNLRALEQRLRRGNFRRTLNYPKFSSETVTKYAESFWGDAGSGVLVVARDTQRILLGLRSDDVNEPNTWGNFGGAIGVTDSGEPEEALPPEENALKEMAEEIGYTGAIEMIPSFTYRSPEFTYYNFIGLVDRESDVPLNQFNWEVSELRWFTLDEVMALPNLHFGVSALLHQGELMTLTAESESKIKLYTGDVVPVHYDESGQPYVTLYHATTMDNFEIIEATGLKPFTPGYYEKIDFETYDNVEGIYFATDLEQAQKWIGWKYRETICMDIEYLEEEGYEVSLVPNEIAGVVYAVDFPVSGKTRFWPEGLHADSQVLNAWYATEAISRLEMNVVGFYSVPICLYGRQIEPSEIKDLSEFEAKEIHERGFYVDAIPRQTYHFQNPPSSEFLVKYPHIASPFTVARRKGRRYLPLYHILSPRDPFFSGYRGTFMAESVPKEEYS